MNGIPPIPGSDDSIFYRRILDASPDLITRWNSNFELTYANPTLARITGVPVEEQIGMVMREETIKTEAGHQVLASLKSVLQTGEQIEQYNAMSADGIQYFHHSIFIPEKDEKGTVTGILCFTRDVTDLKTSESLLRTMILEAPVATALYVGIDLEIKVANDIMISYWNRDRSVIGKPLGVALPELAGQQFLGLLEDVYLNGATHQLRATPADLLVDGVLRTFYFDFTYKPVRNFAGEVYAILHMAVDVTEEVLALQQIREAESNLRGAVDMAQLGTWELDVRTNKVDFSPRLRTWFGIGQFEEMTVDRADSVVAKEDLVRVKNTIEAATHPGSDGFFQVEYTLNPEKAGQRRILSVIGRAFFNSEGVAYKMSGTVQDVTEQRSKEKSLQELVQLRTEELEAANEELSAINEELESTVDDLADANDELVKSNQQLIRSNDNLQQFSYVASHDLQEPLRKIQSFGNLLESRFGAQLGEGMDYLQRMRAAAGRMSVLIEDLLSFSRISNNQTNMARISIASVVHQVISDLELSIQETGALVKFDKLPAILGDQLQLIQLFTNLLSNAIKFRKPGVSPRVTLVSTVVDAHELPGNVQPALASPKYYRIDVIDNGIGFDPQYANRIFQVFQRLHGKSEFAGTGIGLAICDKVVANHGGAITASSEVGQGATFSVYFPY